MAFRDLRDYLKALEGAGELRRVTAEVSPLLEITEIADRVVKKQGPALLFERVTGAAMPVAINLFGSVPRVMRALEVGSWQEWSDRLDFFLEPKAPTSLLDKVRTLPKLAEVAGIFPKVVKDGPVHEVVKTDERVDLNEFPVLQCWPEDGGRFFTLTNVITRDPASGGRNCGMYRLQLFDRNTTGMHWHLHHDAARIFRDTSAAGRRTEVAVAFGGDPATMFAPAVPLPPGIDEMLFAGFVRREPVEMVRCLSVDLEVPARAELVLEGWVDPNERRREGPFGDHTGFYSLADDYPVFHVTAVTHRKDAIYPTTIVGRPPMEDCYMGYAIERMFLPLMRKMLPEVVDYHMPFEGVFHNLMIVAIDKRVPQHARKVMHGIWGLGQATFTKVIVVVDADVDVQDPAEVAWRALGNIDPRRDLEFVSGPAETLDHASAMPWWGSKVGIDATRKWPSEGFARPWPGDIVMSPEVKAKVDALWSRLGIGT
ncbi:MAG: menaquinone biosynthesis decarboxylase [Thermoanaerobaculaceae bacterium]|nr:menaquinone biosynthesis decarboxylase [Thermoanaerobaculaceae bacterium]